MTQMIAERINEIRKNKNVSVQTIVDNGISKVNILPLFAANVIWQSVICRF